MSKIEQMGMSAQQLYRDVRNFGTQKIIKHVVDPFADSHRDFFLRFSHRVMKFIEFKPEDQARITEANEYVKQGFRIIGIGNHQMYVDAVAMADKIHEARGDAIKRETVVFFAPSLLDGRQGLLAHIIFKAFNPHLDEKNVTRVAAYRQRDDKYGYTEQERTAIKRASGKTTLKSHGDIAILPEADQEAGRPRTGDPSKINGMHRVTEVTFAKLIVRMIEHGERFVIMPFAFDGTYRLLNPTTKLPGLQPLLDLPNAKSKKFATARIGELLTDRDLLYYIGEQLGATESEDDQYVLDRMKQDPDLFFNLIMPYIAQFLSTDAQGEYYKEKISNLPEDMRGFYR